MVSQTRNREWGDRYRLHRFRRLTDFDLTLPAPRTADLFFVLPVAMLLTRSVTRAGAGSRQLCELLAHQPTLRIFANTFIVSGLVTFVSLLIGFPVAWATGHHAQPPRHPLCFAILLLSMWTNLLARTYRVDGVASAHRCHQQECCLDGGSSIRPLPLVNNLTGVTDRHDLHHVALHHPAALWRHPEDRSWPSCRRLLFVRQSLAVARARAAAARNAGHGAGALMVFVMSPRLLQLGRPAHARRYFEHDARGAHAPVRPVSRQLGHGGAAALVLLVVTLALYAVQLVSSAQTGWEGA